MSYPKYLYSSKEAVIVKNQEEEKSLGSGWFDSPSKAKEQDQKEIKLKVDKK